MKLYCVVIYVTSSYIWQTQPQCRWKVSGIIYSVECEFFVDICLCYHNSNDTYYVRMKMMEFVPDVPMLPSWIIIPTPGSMQLDGGDLIKIHTYLCEDINGICQLLHY